MSLIIDFYNFFYFILKNIILKIDIFENYVIIYLFYKNIIKF